MDKHIRHWWIQKHKASNMPSKIEGAVFEDFMPTTHLLGFEWVKVFSAEDLNKEETAIELLMVKEKEKEISHLKKLLKQAEPYMQQQEFEATTDTYRKEIIEWCEAVKGIK